MRAVIIDAPTSMQVGNVPDPTPRSDELLIRVEACGICGTDLHIIDGESPLARYPVVPGHEFAGEVVALGDDVAQSNENGETNITVGSRVAIDPNLYCGHCDSCRTGHENLCLNYSALGVTTNGAIDATGVPAVIENAFMAVKRGGKFMVFGVASNEARISLSPFRIYNDEITILGSMAILFSFQAALDLLSGGVIDTQAMLTAALPLEDFPRALDMVRQGKGIKT